MTGGPTENRSGGSRLVDVIEYLDGSKHESSMVEFVGGPRAGERVEMDAQPPRIDIPDGTYVRSASCADDGARRYVWRPRQPS